MIRKRITSMINNGFLHVILGSFLNKAIAMISSVIVARIITKENYAYLSYSETLYGYIILFLGLGMSSALLKVCSNKGISDADWAYLSFASKYGIIFELVVVAIFCALISFIYLPFQEAKLYIYVTLLYPLMYYYYDLMLSFIRAKQLNKKYAYISLVYSICTCIFTILLVFYLDAIGVPLARYIALIIGIIISYFCIKNILISNSNRLKSNINYNYKLTKESTKSFLTMALSLMLANALSGIMPINENFLVSNIIADEISTSNYRIASLFPQLTILVTQSLMIYFFPIVSNFDNQGVDTRKYVLKISLLNLILVLLFATIGIFFTPWLIGTFYGDKYMDAVSIATKLWLVHSTNAAFRMVPMNMLIAIGRYKINLYMSIISVVLQFLLGWYFIVRYGIMGVMYGTIIVYIFSGFMYWYFFLKYKKK